MLTRFIRAQLAIFAIASVVGVSVMVVNYLQAPMLLGIGRIEVTLELPAGGGIYRFANVTYRGVQVGKVTEVDVTSDNAVVSMSLQSDPRIPSDLDAEIRSLSAVGEQYVDLRPRNDSAPYLHDGSVIPASRTSIPQPVGPMLDRLSALVDSVPGQRVPELLHETATALDGKAYDLGSLLDSAAQLSADSIAASDHATTLIDDSVPLLESAVQSAADTRKWAADLAAVSAQLRASDPDVRTILRTGPGAFDEVSQLLDAVKPTLPLLLANLTSLGQVALTYNPSLEQIMVLLPPFLGGFNQISPSQNATGLPIGNFRLQISDPPACTTGFLPPSQWRSPADTTTLDTPDGLYCKLPQDSPIAVRGARNLPCMGRPGKRAPTVDICESDQPYMPQAMRQHALGPYPFDPNLVAQGVGPDDRVRDDERLTAPVEGTPPAEPAEPAAPTAPLPAGEAPSAEPPAMDGVPPGPLAPEGVPPGPPAATPIPAPAPGEQVAPSAYRPSDKPGLAFATYDPRTGSYVTSDGTTRRQADLSRDMSQQTWQQLVWPPNGET